MYLSLFSKKKRKTLLSLFLLLVAHLLVFNFLFTYRYPPQKFFAIVDYWMDQPYTGNWLDYLKLYYSNVSDEANYYEWSTVVLGKSFEADYPLKDRQSSLSPYFNQAAQVYLPYRDISFEYPPLLIVPMLIPRLLANNYLEYCYFLAAILSAFYLGALGVSYKIWKEISESSKISFQRFLFYSLLSVLFLGQLFVARLDIIPSFICLLAIYSFIKNRWFQSAIWVSLGFFTKGYTILLAPLFGIILLKEKKYRPLISSCVGIVVFLLMSNFLLGELTEGRYFDSFKFHAIRGIQIESTYSTLWMFFSPFWGEKVFCYSAHNCMNLGSAHLGEVLKWSKSIQVLSLLCFYLYFWKKFPSDSKISTSDRNLVVIESTGLLVFLFILTFKVFSAQFIIWLLPLLFLTSLAKRTYFIVLFFVCLISTQFLFPNFYWMLRDTLHPIGTSVLIIRNFIFIFLFVDFFRHWKLRQLTYS